MSNIKLIPNRIYTTTEIAEWFGIQLASFRNQKAKKLEELAQYCTYELNPAGHKNKIYVKELLNPDNNVYCKSTTKATEYVRKNLPKRWLDWDTASRVSLELNKWKPEGVTVKKTTLYVYTGKTFHQLYGDKPGIFKEGQIGVYIKDWCKVEGPVGTNLSDEQLMQRRYTPLSKEEKELLKIRFKEKFTNVSDAFQEVVDNYFNIEKKYSTGTEPSDKEKAQHWDELLRRSNISESAYQDFIRIVSEEFNCNWLVKATHLIPLPTKKEQKEWIEKQ